MSCMLDDLGSDEEQCPHEQEQVLDVSALDFLFDQRDAYSFDSWCTSMAAGLSRRAPAPAPGTFQLLDMPEEVQGRILSQLRSGDLEGLRLVSIPVHAVCALHACSR